MTIKTLENKITVSKSSKKRVMGWPIAHPAITKTGVTSNPICKEDETAIPTERFILFFIANVTELTCSAALSKTQNTHHVRLPSFYPLIHLLSNNGQKDNTDKSFVNSPAFYNSLDPKKGKIRFRLKLRHHSSFDLRSNKEFRMKRDNASHNDQSKSDIQCR